MSDGYIQVPPDSTGKKIDQDVLTVSGQVVHRSRQVAADPVDPVALARVKNTQPSSTEYGQVVRQAASGLLELPINFATTGDHILIAAVAGKIIRIWKLLLWSNGDQSVSIRDGVTPMMGVIDLAQGGVVLLPKDTDPWFTLGTNSPLNVNTTQAVQCSGRVFYTQE